MRIFLSYHSPDAALALALKQALEANHADAEVFFAPQSLRAGNFFVPQLGTALDESDAFLLLLGERTGRWQLLEYYEAFDRHVTDDGFPLVPVITAEKAPRVPFLNMVHWIEAPEPGTNPALGKILAALTGENRIETEARPWTLINPYRGLEALGEADADYFFGRERETAEIIEALNTDPDKVIALVGNSGVGKSSLAQAGVIAALKRKDWPGAEKRDWPIRLKESRSWLMLTMKPGDDPVRELVRAFVRQWYPNAEATDPKPEQRTREWVELLAADPDPRGLIEVTYTQFQGPDQAPPAGIFLYVDQGEELYARAPKACRDQFSKLLATAAMCDDVTVLTSLRSDYYGDLQNDKILFPQSRRIDVPPLGPEAFRAAIEKPAELLKVSFESVSLIDQIVAASADQPGALPLIADLLTGLWDNMQTRNEDGVLRWSDRPEVIQIGMPLAQKADDFLKAHPDDHDAIRRLLTLKLAHVPPEGEPVRRRLRQSECDNEREWQLIEALAHSDYRLVVTSGEGEEPTAEVAHEILLREWPILKRWLEDEHDFLVWKGQVEQDLKQYQSAKEDEKPEALLMGLALSRAEEWLKCRSPDLAEAVVNFIQSSSSERERLRKQELEQERSRADEAENARHRQTMLARILGGAAVLLIGLVVFAVFQMFEADRLAGIANAELRKAQINQSRYLAAEAQKLIGNGKPVQALNIAIHAVLETTSAKLKPYMLQEHNALQQSIENSRQRVQLAGHEDVVLSAQFSPDGTHIVSAGEGGTVRVWRSDGSGEALMLRGHEGLVRTAQFNPNGTRIVSAGEDGTVRVWRSDGSGGVLKLRGHDGDIWSAEFSPDGTRIVSAGEDGTVRVWMSDGSGGALKLRGHDGMVWSARFSPDGTRIVTAGSDGTVRVWLSDGSGEALTLRGHRGEVRSAEFSPDGIRIVSAGEDGTVRVRMSDGSGKALILFQHSGFALSAQFNSDGTQIVSAGEDGTVRVATLDGSEEVVILRGHVGAVLFAQFSRYDDRILSFGFDGTVRVWPTRDGEALLLRGDEGVIWSARFNSDGTRIVSASNDGFVRVWATDSSSEALILSFRKGILYSARYSPDGTRIVTVGSDGTVRVVFSDGSGEVFKTRGRKGLLNFAEFSPDGTQIVTPGDDGIVRVLMLDGSEEALILKSHERGVFSAQFSFDGTRIVSAVSGGSVRVWMSDGVGKALVLLGHEGGVRTAQFNPDGTRIVTAGSDGSVRVWMSDGVGEALVLLGHEGGVRTAQFSPDGTRIVSAGEDGSVRVWMSDGSGVALILRGNVADVQSAEFSSDGTRIVSAGDDGTVRVWWSDGSGEPLILRGHEGGVRTAQFSPDGTRIVSAGYDGTVRVWWLDGSGEALILRGHEGWVRSAQFSPDGARIVSAGFDGTVRVWRHRVEDLVKIAIKNLPRCLTPEERVSFFLDPEDPPWCERFRK